MQPPVNDGYKIYTELIEINARTSQPTGQVKPNIPTDPNYIAPASDTEMCPIPSDPTIGTYNITLILPDGFTTVFKLLYGVNTITHSGAGTWSGVNDITYDGVVFASSAIGVPTYLCKITYNSGLIKQSNVTGIVNLFIPGPFNLISKLEIIDNTGDYNDDYNDDYYN